MHIVCICRYRQQKYNHTYIRTTCASDGTLSMMNLTPYNFPSFKIFITVIIIYPFCEVDTVYRVFRTFHQCTFFNEFVDMKSTTYIISCKFGQISYLYTFHLVVIFFDLSLFSHRCFIYFPLILCFTNSFPRTKIFT